MNRDKQTDFKASCNAISSLTHQFKVSICQWVRRFLQDRKLLNQRLSITLVRISSLITWRKDSGEIVVNVLSTLRNWEWFLFNWGPHGELLTKQKSFLKQPYVQLARIASWNFVSLFLPATISLASLHETHICTLHFAISKQYTSKPTHDKLNQGKIEGSWPEWCISTIYHAWDTSFWSGTLEMEDMITAGVHGVSNSWLLYIYTYT